MAQNLALKTKVDTVRAALTAMMPQMKLALPHHLTPERLMRVTMSAVQNNPKLLDCDRTSLFAAVMTCAQLGLEPDGVLGLAYLVPYGNKVQFIPGYKGYLLLARNSGEMSTIQAHEVCANDFFEYAFGIKEKLEHIPADGDRGEIKYFYAYGLYKDGGHIFEVMSRADVDAVRDNSDGYKAFKSGKIKSNPWDSNYVQMGRKTAIRRLANYLPLNVQRAAVLDAAAAAGKFASTDVYGDVVMESVIEGSAEEVAATQETGARSATAKLDQLAGNGATPASDAKSPKDVVGQAGEGGGEDNKDTVAHAPDKPATMTSLIRDIKSATSSDDVDVLLDLSNHLSDDHKDKVIAAAVARKAEFTAPAEVAGPTPGDEGGLFGDK